MKFTNSNKMKYIKKWNWSLFVVVLCLSEIGALTNKSFKNVDEALIIGLIFAILLGIPMAILTRDDEK